MHPSVRTHTAPASRPGADALASGARVLDGTVVRVREAYPVYDSTYRANVSTIRDFLDGLENFHSIGRNGMHKYNNQDHSMLTAMLAVANLQGAQHDLWDVNTEYEYHEEQRLDPGTVDPRAPARR